MTTLKLDTTGDLAIESNSLVLQSDLVSETAQRLKTKFQFFLGEWHLDTRIGMPHFEKILVKAPNIGDVTAIFREVILTDTAVSSLESFVIDIARATRVMSVAFEATLNDGSLLVFDDFILEENK